MAYIADLTPYNYVGEPREDVLAVGWLSQLEPFTQGEVPPEFLARLTELVQQPVNLFRGSHQCEYCPSAGLWLLRAHGNGEIRVVGTDGITYVAPALIAHYVAAHHYQPPQAFVHAVMDVTPILPVPRSS